MARYHYQSYRNRRDRLRRRIYLGAVVVIVVLVFFLIVTRNKKDKSPAGTGRDIAAAQPEQPGAVPAIETWPQQEPAPLSPHQAQPDSGLAGVVPTEAIELNPEAEKLIDQAAEYVKTGKIIAARDILNDVLLMPLARGQRQEVKKQLSGLAEKWLFSRDVFPDDRLCGQYKVRPGDRLSEIAKRYKVPHEILMQINNIPRAEALQAGDTVKVINGPFHAKVCLSAFTMDIYLQKTYVRSFRIGHGREGRETPTGRWRVKAGGKLKKPTWTDPDTGRTYLPDDPDYPLGSRWIGLEGLEGKAAGRTGFAIHGTKDPGEIGTRSSKGCIRLHNGSAILIYNLLVPVFSEVIVQD